jgi:ribosomal protein S18 acetylase RimI-like enzyme
VTAPARDVAVRQVRADEWEALRDLRLRALADAPEAFSTTLAQGRARSEADWREAARKGASGERQATFVADDAGALTGMVTGFLAEPGAGHDAATLIQMWVAPEVRRSGVGSRLVRALIAWAAQRGAPVLRLQVNASEARPIAFYGSLGFHDTGRREPLFPGREMQVLEMEAPIAPPRPTPG